MELIKYIKAQEYCIKDAKYELRKKKKVSHWIWFVFPQLRGLGRSIVSDYYGLNSVYEAMEFYHEKYLRKNLNDCFKIVMKYENYDTLLKCLGEVDAKKVHSCASLFYIATDKPIFKKFIDKFFNGLLDERTVVLLG